MKQALNFRKCGADHGRIVVYFHGAPGAPDECGVFDLDAKMHGLTLICFDRFSVDPALRGETYYQVMAEEISKIAADKPIHIIGFSIGAFIALQTCRHLNQRVESLHLVSAAAPLEAGNYLDLMAGKRVFRLAKASPALFSLLCYWQGLLASLFPNALFRLLFANAAGGDKALASDHAFKSRLVKQLRSCFAGRARGYARDIDAYVRPWTSTLAEVSVDTHIWHGAEDNWSPKPMADYLRAAIPGRTSAKIFDGLSHYSCLYRAAPDICALIGKA